MKYLIFITVLSVTFSIPSCAQKPNTDKVPEEVLSAFQAKFPHAKKIVWEMEDETEWEAEFKIDGKAYSANYNTNGEWLETEYKIKASEIPSDIRAILDQHFTDYEIEAAEMAETAMGTSYEFEMEVAEEALEVTIDSQGNLTKKKEEDEKDED